MTEETGGEVTIMTPQEGELADSLAASAERIRAGVALMRSGLENYIEGVLRTAEELAKARKLFTADKAFGQWCRDNDFGEDAINKNDRAALVAFGGDLARARSVLEATERKSLQHIYGNEWFPHVRKPDQPRSPGARALPKKKVPVQRAEDNVLRDVIVKLADGKSRSMTQIETAVRSAPSAILHALKRLGDAARTRMSDHGLEYIVDGDCDTLLVRAGLIEAPSQSADSSELAALRAENIALTQKVAELKDLLAAKDREIIELRARLEQPSGETLLH